MVTREFDIVDENVVDVGIRPGLINKSVDYNVSVRTSNISDNLTSELYVVRLFSIT